MQGPRVEGAQVDIQAAIVAPASLRIVFHEAVAPLGDAAVTVTPDTPVTVQQDRDVVLVHFDSALEYDTSYHVHIAGVRAAAGGATVDVDQVVRTPPLQLTWLERAASGDRIVTATPGSEPGVVYSGNGIQDFLPIDAAAMLVVTGGGGTSRASIVAIDGSSNSEELESPGGTPGWIGNLQSAGTDVLYTFSSSTSDPSTSVPLFDHALFRVDLTGNHVPELVTGLGGGALAVDAIIPIPGTSAAYVHTRGGDILRYESGSTEPPALVARYAELVALAGDRRRLSVTDTLGPLIYDLDTGAETRVQGSPSVTTGVPPYIADVVPVRDGRRIERAVVPNLDFTAFDSFIAIDDGASSSMLFRTADPAGDVLRYQVTPNDRYLVAEVSPAGDSPSVSDGYAVEARPRDVTLVVIDIWAGTLVAEWPGLLARW